MPQPSIDRYEMNPEPINQADLKKIAALQPEKWPDICESFEFYIQSPNCLPFKYRVGDKMVGTGAVIQYGTTAWLAHVIVDESYRNQGVGKKIVGHLLDESKRLGFETVLLIATDMGYPVYLKSGFENQCRLLFFKPGETVRHKERSPLIQPYDARFRDDLLTLDRSVSGENRRWLILNHIHTSHLYIEDKRLEGFYIPDLGEGLIAAQSESAGRRLLEFKCSRLKKVVLPEENRAGIECLQQAGYSHFFTVWRMVWGKPILFRSSGLYSRIAGNFG